MFFFLILYIVFLDFFTLINTLIGPRPDFLGKELIKMGNGPRTDDVVTVQHLHYISKIISAQKKKIGSALRNQNMGGLN